jgi:hypothetical protein
MENQALQSYFSNILLSGAAIFADDVEIVSDNARRPLHSETESRQQQELQLQRSFAQLFVDDSSSTEETSPYQMAFHQEARWQTEITLAEATARKPCLPQRQCSVELAATPPPITIAVGQEAKINSNSALRSMCVAPRLPKRCTSAELLEDDLSSSSHTTSSTCSSSVLSLDTFPLTGNRGGTRH